jgi:hypothetical protein
MSSQSRLRADDSRGIARIFIAGAKILYAYLWNNNTQRRIYMSEAIGFTAPCAPSRESIDQPRIIRRKLMRQITEKAIAFVMALAISSGAFNVLIV